MAAHNCPPLKPFFLRAYLPANLVNHSRFKQKFLGLIVDMELLPKGSALEAKNFFFIPRPFYWPKEVPY